jgi:hypothetical protein
MTDSVVVIGWVVTAEQLVAGGEKLAAAPDSPWQFAPVCSPGLPLLMALPACPDLEDQAKAAELLEIDRIGDRQRGVPTPP